MATVLRSKCKKCHSKNGDQYCFECELLLCDTCKQDHLKQKGTKKHHVEKAFSNLLSKTQTCPIHSKDVVFFCGTCCLLICPKCMLEKHKLHEVEDIDSAIDQKTKTIETDIAELNSRLDRLDQMVTEANTSVEAFKLDNAILKTKIKAREEVLKSYIEKRTETLIQELDDTETQEISKKDAEIAKLEEMKLICGSHILRLQNNLDSTSGINLLITDEEGDEDTEQLKKRTLQEVEKMPPIQWKEPENAFEKVDEVFGHLRKQTGSHSKEEQDNNEIETQVPTKEEGDTKEQPTRYLDDEMTTKE